MIIALVVGLLLVAVVVAGHRTRHGKAAPLWWLGAAVAAFFVLYLAWIVATVSWT